MAAAARAAMAVRRKGFAGSLTVESMNQKLRWMEYAVRGPLVTLANDLKEEVKQTPNPHPFDTVTMCNIGNPQQLGQQPLTFPRQVLACCVYPDLREHAATVGIPEDAVARATKMLKSAEGSIGAYSNSKGLLAIRESICEFLSERDGPGIEFDPENIFCTDGASTGVKSILSLVINDPGDGVMIPIPQYPLYTAALQQLDAPAIPYYLDEANGWGLSVELLRKSVQAGREKGHNPRAIVVINPGNPTGQCLSRDNIRDVLEFARDENLVVMADEVYQTNVYADGQEFVSFREVLATMEDPTEVLLASLHSTSKGFYGECGLRGGYLEVANMSPDVMDQLYKLLSVSLCSNLIGQISLEAMVNPPREGDPSYATYVAERDGIFSSLARRAAAVREGLNAMEGVSCNEVEGALYAFPRITLPAAFLAEAEDRGVPADALYAEQLVRAAGICVVPGSGFGQVEGTYHFRTTILPPEQEMAKVLEAMQAFHKVFMAKYSSK